jgi:hypothetical protein
VQTRAGKLELNPVWKLTFDAAKRHNLRVGFRIQMSNTVGQPGRLALPDFLQEKIPLVKIGKMQSYGSHQFIEPRYDHPAFQSAFRELNELLVAEFDDNPLMEYVDLMMYGFWGEGHTSNLPGPFPDYLTAEKSFVEMTRLQLELWKKVPLAVNTQPDISNVGNNEVLDICTRAGCWLRSDSIIIEEPIQIEELRNRPPWLAVVMEDGYYRQYKVDPNYIPADDAGINVQEIANPIPFENDSEHASYDPEYANRLWRILVQTATIFEEFRGHFTGKCSPVNFYWGSFDLAVTRFSGRRAPARAGADLITREAYSHECISAGFWPGAGFTAPAFYSYTAPAPPGLEKESLSPGFYSSQMSEFLLMYDDVRNAKSPREALLQFLQTTYEAGAKLANWDRQALERGN